jgi:hypothetical protein
LEIILSGQDDTVTITGTSASTTIVGGSGSDTYIINAVDNRKLASFDGPLIVSQIYIFIYLVNKFFYYYR